MTRASGATVGRLHVFLALTSGEFQQGLSQAQSKLDAITSGGLAHQQRMLKAQLKDTGAVLGKVLATGAVTDNAPNQNARVGGAVGATGGAD